MRFSDRLRSAWQYVIPQHALSRLARYLSRSQQPRVKDWLIGAFVRQFDVDLSDALHTDPNAYTNFNDFFTRALRPGVRPIAAEPEAVASPVDGQVSQCGYLKRGVILQAKDRDFTAAELLADAALGERFDNGAFATLYLSPRDYHRVHMPVDGRLVESRYIPGRRFSVNPPAVRSVPRLFARNERLAALFDTPAGPLALVLVGALNVGNIETVWAGAFRGRRDRRIEARDYRGQQIALAKGKEMGRFNMGSTVIMLFAHERVIWDDRVEPGAVLRVGQRLGRLISGDWTGAGPERTAS